MDHAPNIANPASFIMDYVPTIANPSSLVDLSLFFSFSFLPLFPNVVCKEPSVFRFAATFCTVTTFVVVVVSWAAFLLGVLCFDDCAFKLDMGDGKLLPDCERGLVRKYESLSQIATNGQA